MVQEPFSCFLIKLSCFKGLWAAGQQLEAEVRFLNRGPGRNALKLGIALNWRQGQRGRMMGLERSCSERPPCRMSPVQGWS